mmetsp:Transcript_46737/g.89263  ORF Transcript_46737/g.89263 Transcript_46737/m.89263 type:complete len:276 (-) Transcript_46737:531-1358(-)
MKASTLLLIFGAVMVTFIFVACSQLNSLPVNTPRRAGMNMEREHLDAQAQWPSTDMMSALEASATRVEVISWSPRIIVVDNVLSEQECDAMIAMAEPKLEKSTVVNVQDGKSIPSSVRTSMGAFLTHEDRNSGHLARIEKRLAFLTMLPPENGEAIQILRYEKAQYYRPHHDFFADEFNKKRGGQRICTVLMYLSTPEEGGETVFPQAGGPDSRCKCGGKDARGVSVEPRKGRAVIFWSQTPEGKEDPKSLHGSCDVVSGVKWSATKWIRTGKFV